jgi:hypothetical protein
VCVADREAGARCRASSSVIVAIIAVVLGFMAFFSALAFVGGIVVMVLLAGPARSSRSSPSWSRGSCSERPCPRRSGTRPVATRQGSRRRSPASGRDGRSDRRPLVVMLGDLERSRRCFTVARPARSTAAATAVECCHQAEAVARWPARLQPAATTRSGSDRPASPKHETSGVETAAWCRGARGVAARADRTNPVGEDAREPSARLGHRTRLGHGTIADGRDLAGRHACTGP